MLAGLQTLQVFSSTEAHARYASGGEGRYKGLIDWLEWGSHTEVVRNGKVARTERTIGGQRLVTECTLNNIAGGVAAPLTAYRPGTWQNDGLDNLYSIGGQSDKNQLIAGLANAANGDTVNFSVSCTSTLNGAAIPMAGLVIADAEASNANQVEYVQATPHQTAKWRIIERFRAKGCTYGMNAVVTGSTLRFAPISRSECSGGPMGIAFMEDAQGTNVTIKGGGTSAVAIGVGLEADFGDAPASYGEAGALFQRTWSGNPLTPGTTTEIYTGAILSTPQAPNTRLGALIDADANHRPSPNTDTDDNDGVDDEDAVGALGTINVVPGKPYTQSNISCTGPGFVAGWLDWNNNGVFDTGERSVPVECTGTSVALTWTVPQDATSTAANASSFLRLRIARTQAELAQPTGITPTGEVEDHAVRVATPTMSVRKNISQRANSADQFALSLREGQTVRGTATTTGSAVGVQSAQVGPVGVLPGNTYTISEVMANGSASPLTHYNSGYRCTARYANGTSTDLGTGNTAQGTITVPAFEASRGAPSITCVFTNAPKQAQVILEKQWIINGDVLAHGEQPEGLDATAQLVVRNGQPASPEWGSETTGLLTGDRISVDESTDVAQYLPLCTILGQRVTAFTNPEQDQVLDAALPFEANLRPGKNVVRVTNEVKCDTTLSLSKTVDNGDAEPSQWTVQALNSEGSALISGQGTASGQVPDDQVLELAESGGPAEWIQDDERTTEEREASPRASGSWVCSALDADNHPVDGVLPERMGVDGTVTPLLGSNISCEAVN